MPLPDAILLTFQGVRFLSDIGGAMGLFMGASVLSFVEVLQLILEIVLFLSRAKVTTNLVKTIPQHELRKDSIFPTQEKLKTTFYNEMDSNIDPNAVSNT